MCWSAEEGLWQVFLTASVGPWICPMCALERPCVPSAVLGEAHQEQLLLLVCLETMAGQTGILDMISGVQ